MSDNLRTELSDSLLEELDFRTEARYQELFRRYNKRRRKLNVTAPKVYYELSGEAVMVSEFVTGFWVKDIIKALDQGDEIYIARLRANGIDPKTVAKRLIRSQYYSFHECPLFHGDPHPGNVLVQPDNKIVMVDFGACGVFSERDRNLVWHMNQYYSRDNVAGMVNMVISIMEPIPHRDIEGFRKELTDAWWQGFYGIKSKHAEAWERTSFRLWLRFLQLIRKYSLPVPRNMVRMIRATLMYDTVAASLYGKINVFKEFESYSRDVARRARYRIEASAIRQLLLGPSDSTFLKLQQIANVGNGILYRVQKFLDEPEFGLLAMAGKLYYAFQMFVKMSFSFGLVTLLTYSVAATVNHDVWNASFVPAQVLSKAWNPDPGHSSWASRTVVVVWFLTMSGIFISYGRRVLWRFGDVDD
jgi:predicted unusual protein kinase regulating ubiquinone biosynthesis (AarF/ABC1/UbiB family)